MYSLKAIFEKQPAVIAGTVRSLLFVAVLVGLVAIDEATLAGIALALEAVLSLFVFSASTSKTQPTLDPGTWVSVAGTADKVKIEPTPPGPVGVEGDADLPFIDAPEEGDGS